MATILDKMVARAIILKQTKHGMSLLLVKKVSEPNTYELPGGRRKRNESWLAALQRELREEVSIRVSPSSCSKWGAGKLRTTHDSTLSVRVVVYTVITKAKARPRNEITECRWVLVNNLSHTALERKTKIILWLYFRFGPGSL